MNERLWRRMMRRTGIDPAFWFNHYLRRSCSCHKWPWQEWSQP